MFMLAKIGSKLNFFQQNEVTESPKENQNRENPFKTMEFTTERLSEEDVINWKIKNFTQLQETKSPKNEGTILTFTAGESLKQSSTWELELKFTKANEFNLFLKLKKSYESKKSVHARYWVSIMGPKLIVSLSASLREYTMSNGGYGWLKFVTMDKLKTDGALINDTLTIQIKIGIFGEETVKDTTPVTPACTEKMLKESSLNQMSNYFKHLLETGEFSDLVIRVKDLDSNEYVEKKVHRNILSSRSPVFEAMLGSQMSEKETGVVTIEDLTPKGLDIMLEFVYTGNLPDAWKHVPEEIVNAAEKYQFHLLKTYCDEWLHVACATENAFALFNLAKKHELSKAAKNISDFIYIKSNFEAVMNMI